jgi:EAL domain-containing protein (putative c-di-GMP-specific phosphodiesterase class I)
MENELRQAVERQEFRVYYQPIRSLSTKQILGFEALARWQHPLRGVLKAERFICAAKKTGLIVPISWWVLKEATQQITLWRAEFPANPPWFISVNLSAQQFFPTDPVPVLEAILKEFGLNPSDLRLEITEDEIKANPESVITVLSQCCEMGVKLSLDDFGTRHSNLDRLQSFPVSSVKIDRSFIRNLDTEPQNQQIVKSIIDLIHNLDKDVIAEGVETSIQAEQLQSLGCECGQGDWLGRPLPGEQTKTLLQKLMDT